MNSDIFAHFLHQNFKDAIAASVFPQNLKNANITPLFKKGDRNSETNYTPVSILPNVSKIYERCLYINKRQSFLIKSYPSISAVSEGVLIRNTV